MAKKTFGTSTPESPPAEPSEPVDSHPFDDPDLVKAADKAIDDAVARASANQPPEVSTSAKKAEPAAAAVPAPAAMTVEHLVDVGMGVCDQGLLDSSAAVAGRRSVLESVATMILAAR